MTHEVAITGIGVCCPLGSDPGQVAAAINSGQTGLQPHSPLAALPSPLAGLSEPDFRHLLKRRKDAKLMTRAAKMGLAAAHAALQGWNGTRHDLGIFVAVGREPPDSGDSEAALIASELNGKLSVAQLATVGRDLYPPLVPLKTLPNMILAHICINLGIHGENSAWASEADNSLHPVVEGLYAITEGRCATALVGGSDSLIALGTARDRLRTGATLPPAEAAAFLLLEPLTHSPKRPTLGILRLQSQSNHAYSPRWGNQMGDCGAAHGALELTLAVADPLLLCGYSDGRIGGFQVSSQST